MKLRNMRGTNCNNTNIQWPSVIDVRVVYLAETPPDLNQHIYRLDTPIAKEIQSLSGKILKDLKSRGELDSDWNANSDQGPLEEKEKLLRMLKSKGILVLDCCHCCTGIDKPSKRRKYVRRCYGDRTEEILRRIVLDANVEVRTCYANPRRLLERKRGFRRTASLAGD
jgi:hypothetical protein